MSDDRNRVSEDRVTIPLEWITFPADAWMQIAQRAVRGERRLRSALVIIAGDPCEDKGHGRQEDRDCLTHYPSDPTNWCPPCIAAAALEAKDAG